MDSHEKGKDVQNGTHQNDPTSTSNNGWTFDNEAFNPGDNHEKNQTHTETTSKENEIDTIKEAGRVSSTENPINKSKKKKRRTSFSCCEFVFLIFGALGVTFGIAMVCGGYQAMFDAILHSQMQISPGSKSYEMWKLTPVPLYLHTYFFNLTNPEEFQNGKKAILEEVGPYCYREYHEKKNLTFHDNNTVTFFQERWWHWDQESCGNTSKDDIIVTLNTIPVSAAWSVRNSRIARESLNTMMNEFGEELVIRATASEIMFDGVEDPILDWMQENLVPENATLHPIIPFLPPGLTNYDKFGWFYGRNHSLYYDGLFNMRTGQDTLDTIGQIDLWNQTRTTDFFDYPCNRVTGSAGEMWPPGLEKTFIEFYSSDLCMAMKLYYKGQAEESHGLTGNRYWGSPYTFANGSTLPGNECYCVKGTCAPYGLLNAESCRMGSPAFISFPHFFNADQFLLNQVDGMHPEEEKHAFIMDLIPELGTPMWVAARMQINLFIRPYVDEGFPKIGGIDLLENVTEVYFPLMWFEETAGIPDDMAGELKTLLFMIRTPVMPIAFSLLIVLGLFTILMVLVLHINKKIRKESKPRSP